MTCFESGFIKEASSFGITSDNALALLKRALEHPQTSDMFKQLPQDADGEENSSGNLEMLGEILKQDLINQQMSADYKKINL
jgi:hypothetical protein